MSQYEYEEGKYVIFTEEDFEKVKSKKDKNIAIERFVELKEIDPLYFDRAFYVASAGAEKAFCLLLRAMEEEGKAGVTRAVFGNKQSLIALRAKDGEMLLNTMYFYDEVQENPAKKTEAEVSERELALAKTLIEGMERAF